MVRDAAAWRAWLDENEDSSDGIWLMLAKRAPPPTSLSYGQALDEALCSGWIDGQLKGIDSATYRQRFTPRRRRSLWSARNVGIVARLIEEGRMRPRGFAEIDSAKGRRPLGCGLRRAGDHPDARRSRRWLAETPARKLCSTHFSAQNRYAVLLACPPRAHRRPDGTGSTDWSRCSHAAKRHTPVSDAATAFRDESRM